MQQRAKERKTGFDPAVRWMLGGALMFWVAVAVLVSKLL
jgi:hypothetical protein